MTHPSTRIRRAFTLVEMLVVVGVIALTVGIAFPTITAMTRDTDKTVGINAVGIAGTTARAYATRDKQGSFEGLDLIRATIPADEGSYSGVAAIFTPANEVRITENIAGAFDSGFPLERIDVSGGQMAGGDDQDAKHHNGFIDILVDYITLPADAGVAGVTRDNSSGPPTLIAPPFAVWFNAAGGLVVGNLDTDHVYYDSNYDGDYDISDGRPTNYDPTPYDPRDGNYQPGNWNGTQQKYELPFEKIETVAGLYVYSKRAFRQSGLAWGTSSNAQIWQWLDTEGNGTLILFSRQSGVTFRERVDR